MKTVAIILLAAGGSSRMGRSKQLIEVDGKALLARAIEAVKGVDSPLRVIVLGADAGRHKILAENFSGISIVVNDAWQTGLGSSIKTGLRSVVQNNPACDAALFLVCDQLHLTAEHLERIIQTYRSSGSAIVTSQYAGTEGVPVLFDKIIFEKILDLRDEEGAKKLLSGIESKMVVPFPGGEVDLDTPSDVDRHLGKIP